MSLADKSLPISDGVNYIKDGYIDYAKEVITERAIPDLYDGLKPVTRKLLWTFYQKGKKAHSYIKSLTISGEVLAYHPHNADAVYKASVLLTDNNRFSALPLIDGNGNFGDVSSGTRAAAPRYTEMKLHPNSEIMFGEMDGIDLVPNFDATLEEPTVLPASLPNILISPSEGIAVGFSSKIPSFNINDVIDLTIEYLRDGECHTVIAPDFTTRGYYVQSNKELLKLMKVGKANLKLRGKVIKQGKEILVTEVPFGKNVKYLKNQIEAKDFNAIQSVGNLSDINGACLSIICKSKNKVDEVLYSLYKDTDLQYSYHANITVVQNGTPREIGVWQVIEEWVKWRREVVKRDLKCCVESCKNRMRESETFMRLINKEDVKVEFVNIVINQGRAAGREFLRKSFSTEEIPDDLLKMVASRPLPDYHTGGKYATDYEVAKKELEELNYSIDNIDETLIKQLTTLKAKYGANKPRLTEITNVDYEFIEKEEEVKVDNSSVFFTLKDNFFKKMNYEDDGEYECAFRGYASDTLVAFDNRGQLIRIYAKDLPINSPTENGTYLPVYLGLEDTDDDYKIMWMGRLDGSEKMLLYSDGTVGFLDTSEWLDSGRQVRVLKNGVSEYSGLVCNVFDEIPEVLVVTDIEGRIGWVETSTIKKKNRTARTRVFNVPKDSKLSSYYCTDMIQLPIMLNNSSTYKAPKVKFLASADDYRGDGSEFVSMI